jgi:ribosome-associated protein
MAEIRIPINASLAIFEHELEEKFVHSGGPGGQNVNKVATSVQLRFDVANSPSLPEPVKARLRKFAGSRLSRKGVIVLVANRHRSQERNRTDARERLVAMIAEAAKPPPPARRATRPSLGARKRRMDTKTKRGAVKKLRGTPREND